MTCHLLIRNWHLHNAAAVTHWCTLWRHWRTRFPLERTHVQRNKYFVGNQNLDLLVLNDLLLQKQYLYLTRRIHVWTQTLYSQYLEASISTASGYDNEYFSFASGAGRAIEDTYRTRAHWQPISSVMFRPIQ